MRELLDEELEIEIDSHATMCGFCYYEGGGKEGLIDTTDPDWDIGRGCSA